MARYIDIDQLIDKIEGTDWYHISKLGELTKGANSKYDIPLYKHSDIKDALNNAPIVEDVVPKSEVEEQIAKLLVSETTELHIPMKIAFNVRTEHPIYKAIEQEVAREVIEHIINKKNNLSQSEYHKDIDDFWLRRLEFWDYIDNFVGLTGEEILAELKKKDIGE